MMIGDEGYEDHPRTPEEIARADADWVRKQEVAREQELLLRRCQEQAPGAVFARVVLGLDGYYVLVLAPHEGWLYGAMRATSEGAIESFRASGPARVEPTLPQVRH